MRIIITGGLGFIGSCIARVLLTDGHEVTLIDNHATSVADVIPGCGVVTADLNDDAIAELEIVGADCLMHLAGPSSGMTSAKDPVGTVAGGYRVTMNALKLAEKAGVKRVLNASSMVVYGNIPADQNPIAENAACCPVSHYAVGKYANERLVEIFCNGKGIGFNQLRMFNVYGPGQDLKRMDQGLVSIFLAMLLKSPKVVSKGPLERFRDIVHIDDVVTAWVKCATACSEDGPINVGSGEAIVYGDLIRLIADELGVAEQLEITVAEGTPGDLFGISADITRMKKVLGFTPRFAPQEGVRRFTRWAMERGNARPAT